MSEHKYDVELDLKGLACPLPVVKTAKGIKEVAVGSVVKVIATDPGALADFPAWAKTSGNEVLDIERNGTEINIYIKKVK